MKKNHSTFLVLFLFSFVIASCGFHLRGSQDLSAVLSEVQLQGTDQHSELGRELTQALASAKVTVLEESDTILNINQDDFTKRVLSVDSSGRANQYELGYQLRFALLKKVKHENLTPENNKAAGKRQFVDLMPAQSINEKREYLFDASLILAKADEESRLKNDMRRAAVLQLMRRLLFSLETNAKNLNSK